MKNLTIAQSLKIANNSVSEKLKIADELAIDADQNWDEESTVFTFEDNSQLKFIGSDEPEILK